MNKLTKKQREKLRCLQEEHFNKSVLLKHSIARLRMLQEHGRAPQDWLERYEKDIDSFRHSVAELQVEIEDMTGVPFGLELEDDENGCD